MGCSCAQSASKVQPSMVTPQNKENKEDMASQNTNNSMQNKEQIGKTYTIGDLQFKKDWLINSKKENIESEYTFVEKMGQGGFGSVFLARHLVTNQMRAIKVIQKLNIQDIESFQSEVSILCELDHPNIIKIIEVFETQMSCYIVTELCQGGQLFDWIIKHKKLTENQAATVMRQIFSAISYCHSKGICHKDIKPENFLLAKENDDQSIKLIDFGLSKRFDQSTIMTSTDGTIYYMAPEIFKEKYTYHCDN